MSIEDYILECCSKKWGHKTFDRLSAKLAEETGEVCGASIKMAEQRTTAEDLDKELGDVLIVIAQFASKRGKTIDQILEDRWREICERNGFVKPF